jgi:hypothetical protein
MIRRILNAFGTTDRALESTYWQDNIERLRRSRRLRDYTMPRANEGCAAVGSSTPLRSVLLHR